jgi:hypothetical protein
MIMEHWWNVTERRKPKYQAKNVPHCTLSTKSTTLTSQHAWMRREKLAGFD